MHRDSKMHYPSPSTLLIHVLNIHDELPKTELQPALTGDCDSQAVDIVSLFNDIKATDVEGILDSANGTKWGDLVADCVRWTPLPVKAKVLFENFNGICCSWTAAENDGFHAWMQVTGV